MIHTVRNGRQADDFSRSSVRPPQGGRGGALKTHRSPTRLPEERFRDRETAGKKLAAALAERDYERPIVLGVPRGGMVVAAEVARALAAELGVVVSRNLEAPYQPELALGAVTSFSPARRNATAPAESPARSVAR